MNTNDYGTSRADKRAKLVAAVMVFAMVLCAFAIAAPGVSATEGDEDTYPSIKVPTEATTISDESGFSDLKADTSYVIKSGSNITVTDGFTLPAGASLYIQGSLTIDSFTFQENDQKVIAGDVYVLNGGVLTLGSLGLAIESTATVTVEAGGEVSMSVGSLLPSAQSEVIISDENKGDEYNPTSIILTKGTFTISGMDLSLWDLFQQAIGDKVSVDGNETQIVAVILGIIAGTSYDNSVISEVNAWIANYISGITADIVVDGKAQINDISSNPYIGGSNDVLIVDWLGESMSVTVAEDSEVELNTEEGSVAAATIVNNGTMTIAEDADLSITGALTNNGTLAVNGTLTNNGSIEIAAGSKVSGKITDGEKGKTTYDGEDVTIVDANDISSITEAITNTLYIQGEISESKTISISGAGKVVVDGSVSDLTVNTVTSASTQSVQFKGVGGYFTVAVGSIALSGEIAQDDIANEHEVVINGNAWLAEDLVIGNGVTLTIEKDYYLDTNGFTLTVDGKATGTVYGDVDGDGDISGLSVYPSEMETITISGGTYTSSNHWDRYQTVIVNGDLIITNGATLIFYGQLVIPEGSSVTVENGTLVLANWSDGIYAISVEGTLVVGEDGMVQGNNGIMSVAGSVQNNGTIDMEDATLTIEEDGLVTVEETGELIGNDIVNYGTLDIYGVLGVAAESGSVGSGSDQVDFNGHPIKDNEITLVEGATDGKLTFTPEDGTVPDIRWSSSNTSIVKVTQNEPNELTATVTTIEAGSANVVATVTTGTGTVDYIFTVNVVKSGSVEGITLDGEVFASGEMVSFDGTTKDITLGVTTDITPAGYSWTISRGDGYNYPSNQSNFDYEFTTPNSIYRIAVTVTDAEQNQRTYTIYVDTYKADSEDSSDPSEAIATTIDNYGTATFDSDVPMGADITVRMLQNGAVLDIQAFTFGTGGSLKVTDNGLVFNQKGGNVVDKDSANTVDIDAFTEVGGETYGQVAGITITEVVTGSNSVTNPYTNTMDISGSIAAEGVYLGEETAPSDMNPGATVKISGPHVSVTGDLVIGVGVDVASEATLGVSGTVTVEEDGSFANGGEMTVSGTVTANAARNLFSNTGTMTLEDDGSVTVLTNSVAAVENTGTVNATKYVSGNDTVYVTIDTALAGADGSSVLTALGKNTVTVSAVLPAGATLATGNATIYIGEENGSDVVLTIAEGARVTGSASLIQVNGTLYAENKTNIVDASKDAIVSDVYSEELDEDGKAVKDGWAKWTNIYTAMAEAGDGDVVEVYKDEGYVHITSNLTIPEGVTLVVGEGKASLLVYNGVTLTVNGTLTTEEEIYAESEFNLVAYNVNEGKKSSVIVVNGQLQSAANLPYGYAVGHDNVIKDGDYTGIKGLSGGSPIAGAYYQVEDYHVVSSLAIAVAAADAIIAGDDGDIVINGAVTAGDIVFTVGDECDTIVVNDKKLDELDVSTSLTVGSLTLVGTEDVDATLDVRGEIDGTVIVGDSYVTLNDITGTKVVNEEGDMNITGASAASGSKTASLELTAGAATVDGGFTAPVTIASGATATSSNATIADLTVAGTFEIANRSGFTGYVTDDGNERNGIVTIENGGVFNVDDETANFYELYVYGSLNIAVATSTGNAGTATADVIGIGISAEDVKKGVDSTTGTVEGAVSVNTKAYVSPDATVSEEMVSALSKFDTTTFVVEDETWFVLYEDGRIDLPDAAPIENAVLEGWYDENGNPVTDDQNDDTAYVAQDGTLYADVNYDIYTIYVLANEAVDDVFIDGQLMQYGMINSGDDYYYGYYAVVSAGTHTISYTLANGYSGDGILFVGGAQQSGMSFTTEGAPATYNLQLSGFEKSGYGDTTVNIGDSDDGMSITDILLIILVVLIVIMAIIVALRMMRS